MSVAPDPAPGAPSALGRLTRRVVGSVGTLPDARGWYAATGVGIATLLAIGCLGFSTGLYRLRPADLHGLPVRLIVVLVAPAFGEEVVFRGLLTPGRRETDRPAMAFIIAVFVFVVWHIVEAETFLPVAAPLFERPDFLTCAAILGAGCSWIRWRTESIWPCVALHWLMVTVWQTWLGGLIIQ